MKSNMEDVAHSSGYAQAQNAGALGATSTETFAQRRSIDEQRKFVQGYRNSRIIGGATGGMRAKTYNPTKPIGSVGGAKPLGGARPLPPRH